MASQKGHWVHSDFGGDAQKALSVKEEQVIEMLGLGTQKSPQG